MLYPIAIMHVKNFQNGKLYPRMNENGIMEWKQNEYRDYVRSACTLTVLRMAFLEAYKTVEQIESFDEEVKKEWKKFVSEEFPGTTPQFRLEAIKIIHAFGILTS